MEILTAYILYISLILILIFFIQKPTILLAGESVHKTHYSTVHGAFESGQNQARVILQDIQSCRQE